MNLLINLSRFESLLMNMQSQEPCTTFTHQQPLQYSLTCTLANSSQESSFMDIKKQNCSPYLHLHLLVPTDTFPKIYELTLTDLTLPMELALIFEDVSGLYKVLMNKQNLQVLYNWGLIRVKYQVSLPTKTISRSVDIRMARSLENELEEIRAIIRDKIQGLGDFQFIDNRIDKLWRRMDENQKIYVKFKEDIDCKVEEVLERMQIQSTKMAILRQDMNKVTSSFDRLSSIICPIFSKLNLHSDHTTHFILQDRKIMYVGDNSVWTQILLKNELNGNRKFEIGFKIVNSKKCNIIAGVTASNQAGWRSSLAKADKERKFVGLSGLGQLYSGDMLPQQKTQEQIEKNIPKDKQSKSNYQPTVSSPIMKNSVSPKSQSLEQTNSSSGFKWMQIIRMCVEMDKQRIYWKNGSKVLMESKIGPEFKNEAIVPYFEFCDTGDSIEFIDL